VLLQNHVEGGRNRGGKNDQRLRREADAFAFSARNQRDSREAHEHATPSDRSQFLVQPESGRQHGPDRNGGNQQAGCARGYASLSVIECQIVEGDSDSAGQGQPGNVTQLRTAKVCDAGVDGEHQRGDQKTQDGEIRGRISAQAGSNPGKSRGPDHEGERKRDQRSRRKAWHREASFQ